MTTAEPSPEKGEIDDDPDIERLPPTEWTERVFLDDTDDIDEDTHDDVPDVDTHDVGGVDLP